ncbi:PorT family protein [Mucilaginibacter hurinus]|uniref:PorT family protein n=1 Tax=Mucilaginibacter hurinus TaxID=2201324 RepID=A0A367GVT3_9SPHI|nr:porin family protein [Mucilaginibacter hurinus]RCH56783.1 PorT family protein [Mucilaginibacter hurinus]
MKKLLLCVALLTAGVFSAKAQFTVGAKAGLAFSKINADDVSSSSVTGYQVGAFARVGSNWFVQPELYLGSSGGKIEADNNTFNGKVKFTTLNVPLLLGKSFGNEDFNVHVVGGPIYSFILDDSKSFGGNLESGFDNYKSSALGYQVGAGVDVGKITVGLRYEGGLTKISDSFDQKQNLWSLSVGFRFL